MARVALVRCRSYERPEVHAAVAAAIGLLGGAARFLPPSGTTLLKPNLVGPLPRSRRATTDPEVVRAVAEVLREAGAVSLAVGDSPGVGPAALVMRTSGYAGILPDWLTPEPFANGRPCPTASHRDIELAVPALDAAAIVNIPKLKTHAYMGLTVAVKNMFGAVVGARKAQWHLRAGENRRMFARLLVEICYALRPVLTVVDGVIAMEGNGPSNGTPREVGLIIAGDDPAAVDAVAGRLLGYSREEVLTQAECAAAGAGTTDIGQIEVLGENLDAVAVKDWKRAAFTEGSMGIFVRGPLARLLKGALTSRPEISLPACRLCGNCAEICPPRAITMDASARRFPVIDRSGCIRCFCCQEACPHGAISVRPGWLLRLGGTLRRLRRGRG
jgi:uncharacterized protein (DUF362 family)/Pyruvate/2-oxoacid:ferredoxin oxidoreductase delta subunit